ncbi:uncharacterized protein [Oscarella lobularis]
MNRVGCRFDLESVQLIARGKIGGGDIEEGIGFLESKKEILRPEIVSCVMDDCISEGKAEEALQLYRKAVHWFPLEHDKQILTSPYLMALGHLGRKDALLSAANVDSVPDVETKASLITALSLVGCLAEAEAMLQKSLGVSLRLVSPLSSAFVTFLEACVKARDPMRASMIGEAVGFEYSSNRSDLPRRCNALLLLKGMLYEMPLSALDHPSARWLISVNIYKEMKTHCSYPDASTFEAALYLAISCPDYYKDAEKVLKNLDAISQKPQLSSFFTWTRWIQDASRAAQGFQSSTRLLHLIGLKLNLELCEKLLRFPITFKRTPEAESDFTEYIMNVAKYMQKHEIQHTTESYNALFYALIKAGPSNLPFLFTYFKAMWQEDVSPDSETFAILVDACRGANTERAAHAAIYRTWRMLLRYSPRVKPRLDTMNKLLLCCEKCGHADRAFYFLALFPKLELQPNIDTFNALYQVCLKVNDVEKIRLVQKIMKSSSLSENETTRGLVGLMEKSVAILPM